MAIPILMSKNSQDTLFILLKKNLSGSEQQWLVNAVNETKEANTARKLYLNYSLCGKNIRNAPITDFTDTMAGMGDYMRKKKATALEISRIWMLLSLLQASPKWSDAVKKLIQVADTSELETFLKYLSFLPNAETYLFAAVEALRTNITTVFEAISKHNPYPALFFTDAQWNQMYLKAAFMQLDLSALVAIDGRANADLAVIISDYAHERWAASREIDPYFWRPVSNFLKGQLLADMQRLFTSENPREQHAAALVCHNSNLEVAKELLGQHTELKILAMGGNISWENLKQ